jgi:DivIVA domain-containing protein
MDSQRIERRDFPAERRGYDRAAVDAHLRAVADEVDALRRRPAGSAAAAGEQVRGIIEAAEASAAEIRARAEQEVREHAARAARAADRVEERLAAIDEELAGLRGELRRLRDAAASAADEAPVATPAPPPEPEPELAIDEPAVVYAEPAGGNGASVPAAREEAVATFDPAAPPTEEAAGDPAPGAPEPIVRSVTEPEPAAVPPAGDDAGARLVALSMALSGSSREEIRDHLTAAGVADADAVAGEVLAGAGR